jgi:hypothetical protein
LRSDLSDQPGWRAYDMHAFSTRCGCWHEQRLPCLRKRARTNATPDRMSKRRELALPPAKTIVYTPSILSLSLPLSAFLHLFNSIMRTCKHKRNTCHVNHSNTSKAAAPRTLRAPQPTCGARTVATRSRAYRCSDVCSKTDLYRSTRSVITVGRCSREAWREVSA